MEKETRYTVNGELRANDPTGTTPEDPEATEDDTKDKVDDKNGKKISGYAIVFNKPSKPIPDGDSSFTEIIDPKALQNTDLSDVVMLSNHDYSKPLATVKAGTLKLDVDEKGLHFEATLPNTTDGSDTFENVKAGNIDSASFRFANASDQWSKDDDGNITRTITNIGDIFEISSVTVPAYDDSSVEVAKRSFDQFLNLNKEKKDTKNMTEKILIDNEKDSVELRSFEDYLRSRGEVRSGLTEDGTHGVLVPNEIVTPIFEFKTNKSDLAKFATVKTVNTASGSYPIATNNVSALNTKEELAALEDVECGINSVDFKILTRAGRLFLSSELIQDSAVDIKSEIKSQLSKMVTNTNNRNIINLMDAKAQAIEASNLDDIKKAFNVSLDPSLDKKVFISQSGFNWLDTQKDSDNRYLMNFNVSESTSATFLGAEVVIIPDNLFPKPTDGEIKLFIGDMAQFVVLFLRSNVVANWTVFDQFAEGLSVVLRSDYQVIDQNAMAKISLKTAAK